MTLLDQVKDINIDLYDYPLPEKRIAKYPLAERDQCRLLLRTPGGELSEHVFSELPSLLPPDAMLVYNNTRVINARLRFRKGAQADGALIEVFCLEPESPRDYAQNFASVGSCSWTCFVGNSKRWKEGPLTMNIEVEGKPLTLTATRSQQRQGAASVVLFSWDRPDITFSQIIAAVGEIPIPPYLNRDTEASDSADYQTVYSHIEGSVAAPTAGLHFTDKTLADLDVRGIPRRELTLHVGAGTFQPVKSDNIGEHRMHSEFIAVPIKLLRELASTPRRVIAVGTTSVRTLESLYHAGRLIAAGQWHGEVPQWLPYTTSLADASSTISQPEVHDTIPGTCFDTEVPYISVSEALNAIIALLETTGQATFIASTRLIIAPGYQYRIVRGMVTNFHQPRSTLLLLVSAFVGSDAWLPLYRFALSRPFRFLSYGDACLLL